MYYYTDGKERYGPFTLDELKEKNINQETLVWKEGLVDWVPARNLSDLQILFPVQTEMAQSPVAAYNNEGMELPPKNWLIESILVTILCCLPLGIVGIILSTLVDSLWKDGHREAAKRVSAEAARWVKIGFIFGLIAVGIYILLFMTGMLTSLGSGIEV